MVFGILIVDSPNNWIGGHKKMAKTTLIVNTDVDPEEHQNPTGIGIAIRGKAATGNHVVNNGISNNAAEGISIEAGASANVIGGDSPGSGNEIVVNGFPKGGRRRPRHRKRHTT